MRINSILTGTLRNFDSALKEQMTALRDSNLQDVTKKFIIEQHFNASYKPVIAASCLNKDAIIELYSQYYESNPFGLWNAPNFKVNCKVDATFFEDEKNVTFINAVLGWVLRNIFVQNSSIKCTIKSSV